MRPLPSLVTSTTVPVSATAKLAPVIPMSAWRNFSRSASARATAVRTSGSASKRPLELAREELGHLPLRLVDRGRDDVRRLLVGELDDVLAQVGLDRRDPALPRAPR